MQQVSEVYLTYVEVKELGLNECIICYFVLLILKLNTARSM